MKREPAILICAIVIVACQPRSEQPLPSVSIDEELRIKANVESTIQEAPLAGLSLAVQVDARPFFTEGYGLADLQSGVSVDRETRFQIGSITKTFTAASIMLLVEDGRIDLDQSVGTYLQELPSRAENVTARQLLAHTSGLPNLEETSIEIDFSHSYSPDELMSILTEDFPELLFEPGQRFHYSNLGYFLLGCLIERVSDLDYADYLQHSILEPLELKSIGPCDQSANSLAQGYRAFDGELIPVGSTNLSLAYSSGALCSTAEDVLGWYEALSSGQVVGRDAFGDMTTPVLLPDGTVLESGLGFIVGDFLGTNAIGHIGRTSGFECFLVHFSRGDITIVVLSNSEPDAAMTLPELIATIREIIEET